ncbi:alpha/beta fold hydrolase [uncultured Anaerococcus sp.]|uniref:alpha/beta fold hydrolase n=1 Tax=uncultured Anaerococcus sp. TaxID=293428 RepID=UPI0026225974|nr:alpha/beta fold hydrolase [uncultured Anaerococcus sp.]
MKYFLIIIALVLIPQVYYYIGERRYRSINVGRKFYKKIDVRKIDNYREYYLTGADGFDTFVRELENPNPKAVVQLVHGMSEHGGNYMDFANYLNDRGYAVVIHDHRGHGKSLSEKYPNGHMERASELVNDTAMITRYMKEKYPHAPIYMLGHSMGSMTARVFLIDNDDLVDKLILTGTPPQDIFSYPAYFLANILCFYLGKYQRSNVIHYLVGSGKDSLDFISYDEENRKVKYKDRLRIFEFTLGYTKTLIEINKNLSPKSKYRTKNRTLPIYNLTGRDDIISKGENGVKKSLKLLKEVGYKNIYNKTYNKMRHEILNETNKMLVYEDILKIFEDRKNG